MKYSKLDSIGPERKKKKKSKKVNPRLQSKMFEEIWRDRPHVSELSGKFLGDEMNAWFFAHILGKGAHPHLKLVKENIMLVTHDEHWTLDQETHKAKESILYDPFFQKSEELKEKYRYNARD